MADVSLDNYYHQLGNVHVGPAAAVIWEAATAKTITKTITSRPSTNHLYQSSLSIFKLNIDALRDTATEPIDYKVASDCDFFYLQSWLGPK